MGDTRFSNPVYVADGSGMIREIACLDHAIDFLETLRAPVNGTLHDTALKACYRAATGVLAVEHARQAVESFAKISRLLENASTQP